ncbi:MAG: sigma-54-dependent Fis family transcriptional regulator [Planctomycetaceae bacterium]|nr:sigma-54-dependent Fis family transcriptional regulator [Planctomycetaceae bacterium]
MSVTSPHWISRAELQSGDDAVLADWSERLMRGLAEEPDCEAFLKQLLPELSAEFSAQSCQWWMRGEQWVLRAQSGRQSDDAFDLTWRDDVLDREEAVCSAYGSLIWLVVPIHRGGRITGVLALGGKSIDDERAVAAWQAAQMLAEAVELCHHLAEDRVFAARLKSILNVSVAFATAPSTESLLKVIAEKATQVLSCDRASIFLWDQDQHEVVAVPALGIQGGSLRIPDDRGIVGEVIQTQNTVIVNDAYADARFNQKVDQESGYKTHSLLCCPLKDGAGKLIGAFEVINKLEGEFNEVDGEILSLLGTQAANALNQSREREELIRSHQQLAEQVTQGVQIVGESSSMEALKDTVNRLATTDLPVLILGESGTGKEVVSQSLHYKGPRKDKPFIAVNCAALAETLLESELFGHEKGAFTDAKESRAGKFELADGGTLFLDEIGDMSPGGQAKLLRVLEQKVITRVGGSQTIPIDVRVIAATNSDLTGKVSEGKFREDLYYRLSVVTIDLLPLRERPEDILPLAEHFIKQFCRQANRPTLVLTMDARRRLQSNSWPGNVRELRNLMERVAFLTVGDKVQADDLAFILSPERQATGLEPSEDLPLDEATKQFQREFIRRAIKRVQDNVSEAARLLGVHRSNLYRKMKHLDMSEVGGDE